MSILSTSTGLDGELGPTMLKYSDNNNSWLVAKRSPLNFDLLCVWRRE